MQDGRDGGKGEMRREEERETQSCFLIDLRITSEKIIYIYIY